MRKWLLADYWLSMAWLPLQMRSMSTNQQLFTLERKRARFAATGATKDNPRLGQPSAISDLQKRTILRSHRRDPFKTATERSRQARGRHMRPVSRQTVSRMLKAAQLTFFDRTQEQFWHIDIATTGLIWHNLIVTGAEDSEIQCCSITNLESVATGQLEGPRLQTRWPMTSSRKYCWTHCLGMTIIDVVGWFMR